ncbi:carboxylesterase [Psychrobacillus sp. OK032]|uniref:alpha/beta hydrolase n=1 Tax=Psychrobacillus sp. OK032 TaxID=1884358 RepID=UPI0008D20728|nr:hypothetical protein [Psychrobacillus sp. OK032]SES43892.1 carboxylesterase [Psychrobacillus sp. OK032]
MKRIVKPKPFFLKGGKKAVLLLHSFTSNTRDVRQLGKFINKNGFSCFAPVYDGHGLSPVQLFLLIQLTGTIWRDCLISVSILFN